MAAGSENKEEADKGSVSHARVLYMRNLIIKREEERLFKKLSVLVFVRQVKLKNYHHLNQIQQLILNCW